MDNATHALAGLLLAEALIQYRDRAGPRSTPETRGALRWVSALANNLNDLDSAYASRLGGKLGYLLHHRGHTHTLLLSPLLGLALFGGWLLVARLRKRPVSAAERWPLLGLCLLGPFVHIGLDSLNNYGVHPLWPADSSWYFGDSLFIIEPWLWVVLVPALAQGLSSRLARGLLWSVLGIGLALAWGLGMAPWGVALALTVASPLSALLCRRVGARARFGFALGGSLLVLVTFALGSRLARAEVTQTLSGVSSERLLDVVITPAPGNPLCFSVVTASLAGDRFTARAGSVSLLPSLVSTEACRIQPTGLSVGLWPPTRAATPGLNWEGEWSAARSELARLSRENCQIAAWLRFARVPFWREASDSRWLVGDVRFDRDPDLDFDEFYVAAAPVCPPWTPPWTPPRADLLE